MENRKKLNITKFPANGKSALVIILALAVYSFQSTAGTESLTEQNSESTLAPANSPQPDVEEEQQTEISSDEGSMDFAAGTATFKGNVRVLDQDAIMTSDKLIIELDEENQIKSMEATGNVEIRQPEHNRVARSGYAYYTAETRTVILMENPSLQSNGNLLRNAGKIVYNMDSERIITESGIGERTTVIIPSSSSSRTKREGSAGEEEKDDARNE